MKKLISFLTIICCLAGSILTVNAGDTVNPRVVFTNRPDDTPKLLVTKQVESVLEDGEIPEGDRFQFILKYVRRNELGVEVKEIAANVRYSVTDPVYGRLMKADYRGIEQGFKTDSNGVFTLEAGQTATFFYEDIKAGITELEISEMDSYLRPLKDKDGNFLAVESSRHPYQIFRMTEEGEKGELLYTERQYEERGLRADGYRQTEPAGGASIRVVMGSGGESVGFTNQHTPKSTGDKMDLQIRKTISFPAGFTLPETPEFTFVLKLKNKPYSYEEYEITDTDTGLSLGTGTTDQNGSFTMKGGWTVTFREIPVNADYSLEEINMPQGWWATGKTLLEGATNAQDMPLIVNNRNVSFVVTKKMEDRSRPDVDFTFYLKDGQKNPMPGMNYYLYRTTGKPVYEDDGVTIAERATEEDGSFVLKPGQAAVFTGIAPGTAYCVSEAANPRYAQVIPASPDGYNKEVNDVVEILPFENRVQEMRGTLTVSKLVKGEEGARTDDEFHFVLYRRLSTIGDMMQELGITEDDLDMEESPGPKPDGTEPEEDLDLIQAKIAKAKLLIGEKLEQAFADGKILSYGPFESEPGYDSGLNWKKQSYYYQEDTEGNSRFYEIYVPVGNAVYSIPEGTSAPNFATAAEDDPEKGIRKGEFTLKANQTARFESLSTAGSKYMVEEIRIPFEYKPDEDGTDPARGTGRTLLEQRLAAEAGALLDNGDETTTEASDGAAKAGRETPEYVQTGLLTMEGLPLIFTNIYQPRKADLKLLKRNDRGEMLEGAVFVLTMTKQKPENPAPADPENPVPVDCCYTTNEDGVVVISGLKAGTYWLYEIKPPSGYKLLEEPIRIDIVRSADGELLVKIDGKEQDDYPDKGNAAVGGFQIVQKQETAEGTASNEAAQENREEIQLTVRNIYYYNLPQAGGRGIYWYMIGGVLLMAAAVLILYKNKYAGEVQKD